MNRQETINLRGKELLLAIKQHILEEPKRLDMRHWLLSPDIVESVFALPDRPACGTIGCIAGWAAVLTSASEKLTTNEVIWKAQERLEVSSDVADNLFYISGWPEEIMERYTEAQNNHNHEGKAKATAEAIDWFIAEYYS